MVKVLAVLLLALSLIVPGNVSARNEQPQIIPTICSGNAWTPFKSGVEIVYGAYLRCNGQTWVVVELQRVSSGSWVTKASYNVVVGPYYNEGRRSTCNFNTQYRTRMFINNQWFYSPSATLSC